MGRIGGGEGKWAGIQARGSGMGQREYALIDLAGVSWLLTHFGLGLSGARGWEIQSCESRWDCCHTHCGGLIGMERKG